MKSKKLCLMVAIALLLTVTMNVFAEADKAKEKKSSCCPQQPVQKVEQKVEPKVDLSKDRDIPLSEVPKNIKKIARNAVKGIKLTEAEIEDGNYELEGYVGDDEYEIKITPKGKVLKIEKEDDDKDDDNEKEFDD